MEKTAPPTIGNTSVSAGNPWIFFAVTFAITWGCWLAAIVFGVSFDSATGLLLLLLGLVGPGAAGIAFVYLVYDEPGRTDFWNRIKEVRRISAHWFLIIILLSPVVVITAAVVDIVLGGRVYRLVNGYMKSTPTPSRFSRPCSSLRFRHSSKN